MSKFKVGDRVTSTGMYAVGDNGTVMLDDGGSIPYHVKFDTAGLTLWMYEDNLKMEGSTMSKYEELKDRIEALDNGWDKDADDLMQEIAKDGLYIIVMSASNSGRCTHCIRIYKTWSEVEGKETGSNYLFQKHYSSQCSKMIAFKEALMWLLDHSDIAKEDKKKAEKRDKLQAQLDKIQEQINNMEG